MEKVQKRMGGTMGGDDEESMQFMKHITDMHAQAHDRGRLTTTKGSIDENFQD